MKTSKPKSLILPLIGILLIIELIVLFVLLVQIREGSKNARAMNSSITMESSFMVLQEDESVSAGNYTDQSSSGVKEDAAEFEEELSDGIESDNDFEEDGFGGNESDDSDKSIFQTQISEVNKNEEESVNTENWGEVDWD